MMTKLLWSEPQEPDENIRYNHIKADTHFGRILITWKGWKDDCDATVEEHPIPDYLGAWGSLEHVRKHAEQDYFDMVYKAYASITKES